MDQGQLREQEASCVQDEAPWCTASCPVHVDARALLGHASRGDFDAAFGELKRRIPFPGILARVCDAPCQPDCKRNEAGGAIEIHRIEAASAEFASPADPAVPAHLPKTGKSVAVIGGGLSGLTAAHDLAKKGHRVVLFEAQTQVGGRLLLLPSTHLPPSILFQELETASLGVEIHLGRRIEASEETKLLEEFSAVYRGTGADPALPQGPSSVDPVTFVNREGVFAGGGAVRGSGALSFIGSVSDGRRAAISIDRFLQGVSLTAGRDKEGRYETRLYTSLAAVTESPPVPVRHPEGYDRTEARAEAARCLKCECLECVKVCEYLRHYGSYPKRYVREVYNNLSIVMGMRKSNEFIDSCSLCGLCGQVCPTGLNMAEINLEARRMMTEAGKMPPSAFDFALRDLAFSTGPEFFLARGQPGHAKNAYLFFPGCQLCASLPYQVERVYSDLREGLEGGVALVLGCCGAPAEWAGQEDLADSVAQNVAAQWQSWGRPTVIAGCPTCRRTLAGKLPGAKVENLLEVLEKISLIIMANPRTPDGKAVAIHDACTAREDDSLHACVRRTLEHLGYPISELPTSARTAECCGYGGLMYNANRTLAESVTRRRMNQSPLDFVTYCAMCRDRFNAQEKQAFHVLELIYGVDTSRPAGPASRNFSERRENRRRLRRHLLAEVWGEKTVPEETSNITHDDAVRKSMEERFILWEDVTATVRQAESTGKKLRDEASGLFIASHRPGHVTYWVWYEKTAEQLVVRRVYCHRMEILGTSS